jgi:hypothetical protein
MNDAEKACACEADDAGRSVRVLNIGFVHNTCQLVTLRIRHDMSPAALDLLSGVEAAWFAGFSCFDALTVNDGVRQFFIATEKPACDANKRFVEKIEDAAIA